MVRKLLVIMLLTLFLIVWFAPHAESSVDIEADNRDKKILVWRMQLKPEDYKCYGAVPILRMDMVKVKEMMYATIIFKCYEPI